MSQPPLPRELAELLGKLEQELQTAQADNIRWNSTHCPICREPLDLKAAGLTDEMLAEPFMALIQMDAQLGYCLNCGLSPREVDEEEISHWVWVRVPGRVEINGLIGNHIAQAQGANWGEVLGNLDFRYPNFKRSCWLDNPNALPRIRIHINNDSTHQAQDFTTPVQGGDFIRILIPGS